MFSILYILKFLNEKSPLPLLPTLHLASSYCHNTDRKQFQYETIVNSKLNLITQVSICFKLNLITQVNICFMLFLIEST